MPWHSQKLKLVFHETKVTIIISWKGRGKALLQSQDDPKWDKNTEGSPLESWAKLVVYPWGGWLPSSHSRPWRRGWRQPSGARIPQPLATRGKSGFLVSKAVRKTPTSCPLWVVEMGAVNAHFAPAGLLHPIGHVMAPGPGVLHEWEGTLLLVDHNVCFAQLKSVDSPISGHRLQRRSFVPPDSLTWLRRLRVLLHHAQGTASALIRSQVVGCRWGALLAGSMQPWSHLLSPPRCQQPHSITGFDLMSVRMGQVLGTTIMDLWYLYGWCLVAETFHVISFRLRMALPSGSQSSQCCT